MVVAAYHAPARRTIAAAIAAGVLAATISACAGSAQPAASEPTGPLAGLTATQIYRQSMANAAAAPVLQARVALASFIPVTYDLTIVQGKGCVGTVTYSKSWFFKVIENKTTTWIQPSDAYYRNLGDTRATVAALHGKYVNATGTGLAQMASWCSLPSILNGYLSNEESYNMAEGAPTVLDGQRVVKLSDTMDSSYGYASDTPHPELVQLDSQVAGTVMDFSYPAVPPAITPPPASLVIMGTASGVTALGLAADRGHRAVGLPELRC